MENNTGLTNRQKALSIYKWTLRKYLPFSIAYWILLFMTLPMIEIIQMIICGQYKDETTTNWEYYISEMKDLAQYLSGTFFAAVAILFSAILTIMAFSYMHNKRAVDFFGSFPVSRRTLFFSRFMSVMTASIIPMLIFGSIGAFLTLSDAGMITTFKTIGILMVGLIGNISFIAFISLCCGTVVDVIISYGVINVVYPICVLICYIFPKSVIPGLSEGYLPGTVFTLFCPAAAPFVGVFGTGKILSIVWWILISVILIASCGVLCKKRKAETAQNAFAFAAVEMVIKFIACFAAGFGAGWVFSFFGESYDSVKAQYIWFVIGLVMGIMIANILLHLIFHRGLSKYKKSLVECGVVFVASIAFLLIVVTGAFGYDMRIPDADKVKEVSVRTGDVQTFMINGKDVLEQYSSDKEIINDAVELHNQITEALKKSRHYGVYAIGHNTYGAGISASMGGNSFAHAVRLAYKLNNGRTMKRTFYISTYQLNISKKLKNITIDNNQIFQVIPDSYLESICISSKGASVYLYDDEDGWDIKKVRKVLDALRKDVKGKGTYEKNDGKYAIQLNYNNAKNEYAQCKINVPETYHNTLMALEETRYSNVGYYQLRYGDMEYDYDYDYDSTNGVKLLEGRTIYFEVPDNWDQSAEIQCMPYYLTDEEYEESSKMTNIDDKVTQCEKVSDKIWKYTMKIPQGDDADDYNGVMFYQITKNEARTTGIIKLSKKKNLLIMKNYPDINDEDFYMTEDEDLYDYKWDMYEK